MTKQEVAAAIAVLEKGGYTVLAPAEASALKQVLPMLSDDEIDFVFGHTRANFNAALRKFGLV